MHFKNTHERRIHTLTDEFQTYKKVMLSLSRGLSRNIHATDYTVTTSFSMAIKWFPTIYNLDNVSKLFIFSCVSDLKIEVQEKKRWL